jgi:hypothetical protein
MSRTLLSLAGFQVILIGRFWVIAEATQCELRRTLEFTIDRASYRVEVLYCYSNPKSRVLRISQFIDTELAPKVR